MALILFYFFNVAIPKDSSNHFVIEKNLQEEWEIRTPHNQFVPFEGRVAQRVTTIYFDMPNQQQRGSYLSIESTRIFSIFLDEILWRVNQKTVFLNVDSLHIAYPTLQRIGIYQREGITNLNTSIMRSHRPSSFTHGNQEKHASSFLDFSIIGSFILFLLLAGLRNQFPRYTWWNLWPFTKEKNISSSNPIFFPKITIFHGLFISILASMVLLVIFHYDTNSFSIAAQFSITSVQEGFYLWGMLSLVIAIFFTIKSLVIFLSSLLFAMKNHMSFQLHVYSFFKFYFAVVGFGGITCLLFFTLTITHPEAYCYLFYGIIFSLFAWSIFLGTKLFTRTSYSFIYLFSYLCISELFPMVIFIKILTS